MNKFTNILLAASLFAVAGVANATKIEGSIGFASAFDASWEATATDLTFNEGTDVFGNPADAFVNSKTGDYSSVTFGTGADFKNFTYDPFASGTILWTFSDDGIDYSLSMINQVVTIGDTTASIVGRGIMTMTGLDDTEGSYSITLNNDGDSFTWSSSAATPEPAITMLLATGLIGFGFARKMRKSA